MPKKLPLISLKCSFCGNVFDKHPSEYNRKIRLGYDKFYCSKSCLYSSRIDQLSPFRQSYYYSKHSAKRLNRDFNLSLEFLKELWIKQDGKCSYSKVQMILPSKIQDILNSPIQASIDRIDPSKGYTKDNVEYVCLFVNLGKNQFSKDSIEEFFKSINANMM